MIVIEPTKPQNSTLPSSCGGELDNQNICTYLPYLHMDFRLDYILVVVASEIELLYMHVQIWGARNFPVVPWGICTCSYTCCDEPPPLLVPLKTGLAVSKFLEGFTRILTRHDAHHGPSHWAASATSELGKGSHITYCKNLCHPIHPINTLWSFMVRLETTR